VPNIELAAEAGLELGNGILVNDRLQTSDPAISAIGDVAFHPNPHAAGMVRLESVQNAVDQGKHVAARVMRADQPYDALPWFWSRQGATKRQMAGLAAGMDDSVLRGDPDSGKFSVFVYRANQVIAVESVNGPADHMVARRLLAAGLSVSEEMATDPAVDLKTL